MGLSGWVIRVFGVHLWLMFLCVNSAPLCLLCLMTDCVKVSAMKPGFFLAALLAFPLACRANDSSFEGVGGSLRPTKGENKAIRMKSEVVILTAHEDTFSTRAEFVFANETAQAQNVAMGFPEGNYGDAADDSRGKSSFKRFATFVDGRKTPATRTVLKNPDAEGPDVYWVKTVFFAPHQTRHVRVETLSPYGSTNDWGFTRNLSYAFTGANWRGDVGQSVLEVRVSQPGLWRGVARGSKAEMLRFSLASNGRGATFRRVWKNWPAQQYVVFGLERTVPFWRHNTTGDDIGSQTLEAVTTAQTVRVGPKTRLSPASQGFPADGFTRGATFYIGLAHLENQLSYWGTQQKPTIEAALGDLPAGGFDLRAGTTRIQGRKGDSVLRVNGKRLRTGAAVVSIQHGSQAMIYVPLAPLARALGWEFALRGDRLFSLRRGSWRG